MNQPIDTLISGGQIITSQGVRAADIGITGEQISVVAATSSLRNQAETIVDARGLLVLPGAIDTHFHCRTPGYDVRGDFYTETCAAAAGGVTTVFEMPISNPGCATIETFRNRRSYIEQQAIVDVALYGAPGTLQQHDVFGMAAEGAIAFKIFMHRAPLGRDAEFIGICLTEDDQLYEALQLTKATGRRLVVHAESDSLLEAGIKRLRETGRTDMAAHPESRPPLVEALAIARILTLAEDLGAPVHIAHVTSQHALAVIRRFRRDGVDVTAETCTPYLFFDQDQALQLGPFGKINPPIRTKADQEALWGGIADGTIDFVCTDHSTFLLSEKERGLTDIWVAPSGAPGVQTLVPALMTAALSGRFDLATAVRLMAGTPAQIFGIADRKGAIAAGMDADICLYDPAPRSVYRFEDMHSKAREIDRFFRDYAFQGRVVATYSHGRCVFRAGEIVAKAGEGRFLAAAFKPANVAR
jgi:allantoinase